MKTHGAVVEAKNRKADGLLGGFGFPLEFADKIRPDAGILRLRQNRDIHQMKGIC